MRFFCLSSWFCRRPRGPVRWPRERRTQWAPCQTEQLDLLVGRSTVIQMDRPITRVSLSTPDIADALVTTPYELLVHGKMPGTISLLVWGDNGRIKTYDVAVQRDLSSARRADSQTVPRRGDHGDQQRQGRRAVRRRCRANTSSIARRRWRVGYVDKPENVVNLLRQQDGAATNQVMLRVRFAEVSRSAMQELGASFFTGTNGKGDWIGRSTTQQYPAPVFDSDKGLVFSDFLNLFLFNTEEQLGAVIKALKGKGLFQSLAEPNLITQDGKEASFLAGGEYPYPVVQGSGVNAAVTDRVQGVRRAPAVHADGHGRRHDSAEGGARSQLARLRQRGRARRDSACRRSRRAAPRRRLSCATVRRSRSPA